MVESTALMLQATTEGGLNSRIEIQPPKTPDDRWSIDIGVEGGGSIVTLVLDKEAVAELAVALIRSMK